jgi:hypothetical protein
VGVQRIFPSGPTPVNVLSSVILGSTYRASERPNLADERRQFQLDLQFLRRLWDARCTAARPGAVRTQR